MFYLKLAVNNIKNSLNIYAPFLLASLVLYTLTGSTLLVQFSPVVRQMKHGTTAMSLAITILILFSIIMSIYSFNFLIKQRTREFGLYNMLGMRKGQVALIASLELMLTALALVGLGSLVSLGFSNLFYLLFANITHYNQLQFQPGWAGLVINALLFFGIFGLLMILSWVKVGKTSPLVLFRSSEAGEREPRGNVLLAFFSVLALGGGYALSLTSSKVAALAVLFRFFAAVVLVIIGTYLFYMAFVAWFLKRRRANKAYFYQPEHFISTSQMLFRIKQHAVGLANITLLAVMSFVAISTTSSLYGSATGQTNRLFPRSATVTLSGNSRAEVEAAYQTQVVDQLGHAPKNANPYMTSLIGVNVGADKHWQVNAETLQNKNINAAQLSFVVLMTQDDFRALGNDLPQLKSGETAFWLQREDSQIETIDFFGRSYRNVKNFKDVTVPVTVNLYSAAVWVFSSDEEMMDALNAFNSSGGFQVGGGERLVTYPVHLDLSAEEVATLSANPELDVELKADYLDMLLAEMGGFVFTGFLLGTAFLAGAALIIYYKQYSEGVEDKKSYKILQEVGMSKASVKKTIDSQVLAVFFMPIVMAIVHFLVALTMIKQMLLLFGVTDTALVYQINGLAILVILVIYFAIYKLTSRVYYGMIER